ncbi:cell division protein FtsQ/DivIB [Fructobacillus sp. W13]|uniref:Cell division protein FtsQ/DivIB n=1 Tax=Fructobacillus apis TaxID=2935017 RepID=A0ABT0ZQD9_9LACO|nr:cell division protein FtsQ/DivIB [Fructobacillus apis]
MQEEYSTMEERSPLTSAWWALAFFAVLALLLFIWQPWGKIQHINVDSGNIPTETIEEQMGIKTGSYRYQAFLQGRFLANRVKHQNGKVSRVSTQLSGDTLTVTVAEKINAGFIREKDRWYQLDSNGNRQPVNEPDGRGPVYSGFKSRNQVQKVAKAISSLDQMIRQDIGEVKFAPDENNDEKIILVMNDGNTVYASQKTMANKMKYYAGIAQAMDKPGVVDLQIGSYSYAYGNK